MTLGLFIIITLPVLGQSNPADSTTVPLYRDSIPNALQRMEEITEHRPVGGRFVSNTSVPTLTCYRAGGAGKKAIIICPGGGYRGLAIDKEGFLVARKLQEEGIHAFVLKYRTPLDESCKDKSIAPLQDAQQALRKARELLQKWGASEVRIGIMGFSAGGHLAALASNRFHFDYVIGKKKKTIRPDFSILLYPVISMEKPFTHMGSRKNLLGPSPTSEQLKQFSAHTTVNDQTPPTFLMHASDDAGVPVKNSLLYYEACIRHEVPVEMHLYARGGHGFGMYNDKTEDRWIERLLNWLDTL